MKLKKKLLALLMSICCCFTMSLYVASAEEELKITSVDKVISEDGKIIRFSIEFNQPLDDDYFISWSIAKQVEGQEDIEIEGFEYNVKENILTIEGLSDELEAWTQELHEVDTGDYTYEDYFDKQLDSIPAGEYHLTELSIIQWIPEYKELYSLLNNQDDQSLLANLAIYVNNEGKFTNEKVEDETPSSKPTPTNPDIKVDETNPTETNTTNTTTTKTENDKTTQSVKTGDESHIISYMMTAILSLIMMYYVKRKVNE